MTRSAHYSQEVTVRCYRVTVSALVFIALPALAAAQDPRRQSLELSTGYAGFVDEEAIDHFTVGGGWRWRATRRLIVGPEIVYMRGPGSDRDVFLTGKLVIDFMPARRASPYFVADGGIMLHTDDFLDRWVNEGAGSFGGGVRIDVTDRLYIAPEARIGWEPHIRATVNIGWRLPAR